MAAPAPPLGTFITKNKVRKRQADGAGKRDKEEASPGPESLPQAAAPRRVNLFRKTRAWVCVLAAVADSRPWDTPSVQESSGKGHGRAGGGPMTLAIRDFLG